MRRYWLTYRTFFRSSFVRELEFRANFIAKVLQSAVWILFFVLIVLVLYRNTNEIAGWRRGDSFILAATCFLLSALSWCFFSALNEIPNMVRLGSLDFVVTKPIDSQFWVSTRRFYFEQIGTFVSGVLMIAVGLRESGLHPSAFQWISYLFLTFCSIGVFYSFMLFLMTLGIWLVRVDNLWVLGDSVTQIARFPIDIYPRAAQLALTYVLPLALLSTVPARQLVKGASPTDLALGAIWLVVAFASSRALWRYGMRHYTSASS